MPRHHRRMVEGWQRTCTESQLMLAFVFGRFGMLFKTLNDHIITIRQALCSFRTDSNCIKYSLSTNLTSQLHSDWFLVSKRSRSVFEGFRDFVTHHDTLIEAGLYVAAKATSKH